MFVELTRYSPAVGLHAAITLRLEFPAAGRALAALSVHPFALLRFSTGLSLPLLTSVCTTPSTDCPSPWQPWGLFAGPSPRGPDLSSSPQVCLLLFAVYFSVAEARAWRREGCSHAMQPGAWAQWLLVTLTAAAALVRLAQLGTADRQWTRFLRGRPHHFTSFDQVAQLSTAARGLAASLLFLLLVKVRASSRDRAWATPWGCRLMFLVHRLPSSCGLCASGLCSVRPCAGPCRSSWGPHWAWLYLEWPMPSWLFW